MKINDYGEANVRFITKSPAVMTVYRVLSGTGKRNRVLGIAGKG